MSDGGLTYEVKMTGGGSVDPEHNKNKIQHKDIHNEL